jgi:hypothetical protein
VPSPVAAERHGLLAALGPLFASLATGGLEPQALAGSLRPLPSTAVVGTDRATDLHQ